jgi:hypothetical protein
LGQVPFERFEPLEMASLRDHRRYSPHTERWSTKVVALTRVRILAAEKSRLEKRLRELRLQSPAGTGAKPKRRPYPLARTKFRNPLALRRPGLVAVEGTLRLMLANELRQIEDAFTPTAKFALVRLGLLHPKHYQDDPT